MGQPFDPSAGVFESGGELYFAVGFTPGGFPFGPRVEIVDGELRFPDDEGLELEPDGRYCAERVVRRVRHDRLVPRISEFYGIVIEMYFTDHPPPHFHARYSGEEALIVIQTGEVFAGSLPGRALRLIREWLEEHRDELVANWDRASAQQPTEPVAPLR